MSEATEMAPQGMTVEFGVYAVQKHPHAYSRIARGHCFKCNTEQTPTEMTLNFDMDCLTLSHQCPRCGYVNKLVEATVRAVRSDPSLSLADM